MINCGNIVYKLLLAGVFMASFTSCEMKNELWGKDPNELSPEESGYLDLKVSVESPSFGNTETTSRESSETNIIVPEVKELSVKIFNDKNELIHGFNTFEEYENDFNHILRLGEYFIEVSTGKSYDVTLDKPYYASVDTCQIKAKEVATVNSVCELKDAIVYLELTDEFKNDCMDDYSITVTNGSGVVSIGKNDPKIVYVKPGLEGMVTIRATEKETQKPVIKKFLLEYEDKKLNSGDIFKAEIKDLEDEITPNPDPDPDPDPDPNPDPDPDPEEPTGGNFTIKVDITVNEVPVDIVVPSTGGNGGDIGDGGDDGGSSGDAITFTGDPFVEPLLVSAPNGISSMTVQISSTNSEFAEIISGMELTNFDLANLTPNQQTLLIDEFKVVDGSVKDKTDVVFNVSSLLTLLDNNPKFSGDHQFIVTVTDSKGNSESLTIKKSVE